MDLTRNENRFIIFEHQQLTNVFYISRQIFHNLSLEMHAKAGASWAKANKLALRPRTNISG